MNDLKFNLRNLLIIKDYENFINFQLRKMFCLKIL